MGKTSQAWMPSPSCSYCQQLKQENRSHLPFSLLLIKLPLPQGLPHPKGQK